MKITFLLFFMWVTCTLVSQSEYRVFSNEKNQYGIRQTVEPYDTLIDCKYGYIKEFEESFLLCDKYKTQKRNTYPITVKNAKWLDENLKEIKSFEKLELYTEHFIGQSGKRQDIYNIATQKIIAKQVEVLNVIVKNHMKYYGDKTFDYVIFYEENGQYKALDKSNDVMITFPNQQKDLVWSFENKIFKYGSKNDYSVYSEDFNLIAEHITFINPVNVQGANSSKDFIILGNTQGKQMLLHNHILVKEINGAFLLNTGNPNRFVYKMDESFYVIDSTGKNVVDTAYQLLHPNISYEDKHANMVQNKEGEYYFVDDHYKPISDEVFESIKPVEKYSIFTYYLVTLPNQSEDNFYLYSSRGKLLTEEPVDKAYDKEGVICVEKNDKMAFVNWDHELSEFLYSDVTLMEKSDDELLLLEKEDRNQVYSLYYKKLIEVPIDYQEIRLLPSYYPLTLEYSNSNEILLVAVRENFPLTGDFKLVDIKLDKDHVMDAEFGFYNVKNYNGKWGLVKIEDDQFKILVPFEYDNIEFDIDFFDAIQSCKVTKNGKVGLVKMNFKESEKVVEPKYDDIIFDIDYVDMSASWLVFKNDGLYGVVDINNGNEVVPPIIKDYESTHKIINQSYDHYFEDPVECEVTGESKKCIFTKGVACFDYIQSSEDTYLDELQVGNDGKYGIISFGGDTLIDIIYDEIVYLMEIEEYKVKKDGKWGMLKFNKEEHIQPVYDEIKLGSDEFSFIVKKNDKYGVIVESGAELPTEFDAIEIYGDHVFVKKGKKWDAYILFSLELSEAINYSSIDELKEKLGY